jgi:hypothetical protein
VKKGDNKGFHECYIHISEHAMKSKWDGRFDEIELVEKQADELYPSNETYP